MKIHMFITRYEILRVLYVPFTFSEDFIWASVVYKDPQQSVNLIQTLPINQEFCQELCKSLSIF